MDSAVMLLARLRSLAKQHAKRLEPTPAMNYADAADEIERLQQLANSYAEEASRSSLKLSSYRKALEEIRDGDDVSTYSGSQCSDIARNALLEAPK